MAYRVEIAPTAAADADQLYSYLAERAPESGIRWLRRMEAEIQKLSRFPRRHPLAPEDADFSFEIRQIIFGKKPHFYRILFRIHDEAVQVLHIRHGRRRRIARPP